VTSGPHGTDRYIADSIQEVVVAVDAAGEVVYANERTADVLAVSRAELLGSTLEDLGRFVTTGAEPLRDAVRSVLEDGVDERRVELESDRIDPSPADRRPVAEARVTPFEVDGSRGAVIVVRNISVRKQMEESLRHREALFAGMFETHSAPMLLIHPDSGTIEYANRAAVEFYGYDADELTSMRIQELNTLSPEQVARERQRAEEQDRNHFEFEHRIASGETRPVEVHSAPVNVDGQRFLFSIVHDITEQEEYRHELQLFREAVEQTGHSVLITDPEGVIEYVNPAFEAATGYDRAEAIGQTPRLLKSGKQSEAFYRELWETILDGRQWEAELTNRRKSGEIYYVKHTIAPITDDGEITNFVAVQSDITDRKLREKRLSELNRILRHNLRNTLTAILGYGEVLADDRGAGRSTRPHPRPDRGTGVAERESELDATVPHERPVPRSRL
jgi:PAS domain S-box-containing protein